MAEQERIETISEELNLDIKDIRECFLLKRNFLSYSSLNAPMGEDETTELVEFIPEEEDKSVENFIIERALRETLENEISTLSLKEQKILRMRFGFDDNHARTLEEVGQEFKVTRERIRQIEAKALKKLNNPSHSKRLKDYCWETR
jgi:RNA polymerase primary sigma factor